MSEASQTTSLFLERREPNKALSSCLRHLSDNGLTLNAAKSKFLTPSLSFFGQILSARGTQSNLAQISDLQNAQISQNFYEVRSFLGMTNYSSCYYPNYAMITETLRVLAKKDTRLRQWRTVRVCKVFSEYPGISEKNIFLKKRIPLKPKFNTAIHYCMKFPR